MILPFAARKDMYGIKAYTGRQGQRGNQYSHAVDKSKVVHFKTTSALGKGEGLTIVVQWPKGIVAQPTLQHYVADYHSIIIVLLGLFITFLFYFIVWYKVGRDPKKNRTLSTI